MSSLFSQPHMYNVREKKLPVNRKHGSSLETFLRIFLALRLMLRGPLPLSRSRLRGGRREAKVKAKAEVKVKVKVKS